MWLTVAMALGVAILSGLGVGSAGLLVVYLTLVKHLPQLAAQGLNLVFFLFASGAALWVHALHIKLPRGYILPLLLGGIPGCLLGAAWAHVLPAHLLKSLFALLLIASGAVGLLRRKKTK